MTQRYGQGAPSTVEIPFLPGNTFGDPRKTDFRRQQTLKMKNGLAVAVFEPLAIGGEEHMATTLKREQNMSTLTTAEPVTAEELDFTLTYGTRSRAPDPPVPAHVALDKKVLSFVGHFQEPENIMTGEQRIRYVRLCYFLEDDTLSVFEPRVPNSGLPQGQLVKRQKVPFVDPTSTTTTTTTTTTGRFLEEEDLKIGEELQVFGLKVILTDCDLFTREFYESLGRPQPVAVATPADGHKQRRKEIEKPSRAPAAVNPARFQLAKFLENDGRVLRFRCLWDTSHELYGERAEYGLLYYLVDDTIEVREVRHPNDGKGEGCLFLKRQRIPKITSPPSTPPTAGRPTTAAFVTEAELGIGANVNVLGREFVIVEADKFTREYYAHKYGITEWPTPAILEQIAEEQAAQQQQQEQTTKHSTSSTSSSTMRLAGGNKASTLSRKALENQGRILRFKGTLEMPQKEYQGRCFVLSMWLSDDAISVAEIYPKGGGSRFLQKAVYQNPERLSNNKTARASEDEEYNYQPSDLYIGAKLNLNGWKFNLLDSDEATLAFMESQPYLFPYSNLDWVLRKLGDALIEQSKDTSSSSATTIKDIVMNMCAAADPGNKKKSVTAQQFKDLMGPVVAGSLVDHEFITLNRRFEYDGLFSYSELASCLNAIYSTH